MALAVALACVPIVAHADDAFVSPAGDDAASGTESAPVRTIARALELVGSGDTVFLREGVHRGTTVLDVSGADGLPISLRGYPGETAILDSGPDAFAVPGNDDWELVDAATSEWRSVEPVPDGNVYAYVTTVAGYENERMALVPYVSAAAFRATTDEYVDGSTPFYVGPGTLYEDDHVHVRLERTAAMRDVEARYGRVLGDEPLDPRALGIVLSTASSTLVVRGAHLVIADLVIHQAQTTVALDDDSHDIRFENVTAWHGDRAIGVVGPGVHGVTVTGSRLYGDVPLWIFWSDSKDAPAPADRTRGTLLDLAEGTYDWEISWSHIRGGHDGIGTNDAEDDIRVHHCRIEGFQDDAFELEGSLGRMEVYENYIANSLVAIAPGQDSPGFTGPLFVYRNVIALLRNPPVLLLAWRSRRRTTRARALHVAVLVLAAAPGSVGCGRYGYEPLHSRLRAPEPDAAIADAAVQSDGGSAGTDAGVDAQAPSRAVVEIDASAGFTCARLQTGEVWCWGQNESCQTGNATAGAVSPFPSLVAGASDAVALAVGGVHACIERSSGEIACWGDNEHGQLGETAMMPPSSCVPLSVGDLSGVSSMAAGHEHTCAATASGVVCWGRNLRGQLGDGTVGSRATPTLVADTADTIALTAGYYFTCRIARGGQVWCWGDDAAGQLGAGSTGGGYETRPVRVVELGDAVAIGAGETHVCALRASGEVACWGSNDEGQLGDGSWTPRDYAGTPVAGLTQVVALEGGEEHSCALDDGGIVTCWGAGTWGQLGDGAGVDRLVPGPSAVGMSGAASMTAGEYHTCAVRDGHAHCWGWNRDGQLGIGTASSTPMLAPVQVTL